MLYLMVLFPVTLSDPNYSKPPHFRHFVSPFNFHVFVLSAWRQTSNLVRQTVPERGVVRSRVNHINFGARHQLSLERLIVSGLST